MKHWLTCEVKYAYQLRKSVEITPFEIKVVSLFLNNIADHDREQQCSYKQQQNQREQKHFLGLKVIYAYYLKSLVMVFRLLTTSIRICGFVFALCESPPFFLIENAASLALFARQINWTFLFIKTCVTKGSTFSRILIEKNLSKFNRTYWSHVKINYISPLSPQYFFIN